MKTHSVFVTRLRCAGVDGRKILRVTIDVEVSNAEFCHIMNTTTGAEKIVSMGFRPVTGK